jgi:hypothetical protein
VKLRIKTNSSQFTPTNAEGCELLQRVQGEEKVPGAGGMRDKKEVVSAEGEASAKVAGNLYVWWEESSA